MIKGVPPERKTEPDSSQDLPHHVPPRLATTGARTSATTRLDAQAGRVVINGTPGLPHLDSDVAGGHTPGTAGLGDVHRDDPHRPGGSDGLRLDDTRLAVMMLDGLEIAGRVHIVALGISTDGVKVPFGPWEGSTENARLPRPLIADLVDRGLDLRSGNPVRPRRPGTAEGDPEGVRRDGAGAPLPPPLCRLACYADLHAIG